jgi:hypothetical protein
VKLGIYCADIGSVPKARFGWARAGTDEAGIERHRGGTEIIELIHKHTVGAYFSGWRLVGTAKWHYDGRCF